MQATTRFHHPIPAMLPPQPQFILDDPTALHTADHMLNAHTNTGNISVGGSFVRRQFLGAWFFLRLLNGDVRHGKALKSQILI